MLEPLGELLLRLGFNLPGTTLLSADEVEGWPAEFSRKLQEEGILIRAGLAVSVRCDACFEGHAEPVETAEATEGSARRHYIVCPAAGRVFVPPERLPQWRLDPQGLALALARQLGIQGRPREHTGLGLWELGHAEFSSTVHDVLLVFGGVGTAASIGSELQAQRWVQPILLTLAGTPDPADDAVVIPLVRILTVDQGGLVLDRRYLESAVSQQASISPPEALYRFQREGDVWAVTFAGQVSRYRASKGLEYIVYLIGQRGRAVPVLELVHLGRSPVGSTSGGTQRRMSQAELEEQGLAISDPGDGAAILDAQAIQEYKRRLLEIESELHQTSDYGNFARVEALEEEREALISEIKAATGFGGRSRKTPSDQERARTNVRTNISNTIGRIAKSDAALASHLKSSINTGRLGSYQPETEIHWQL